MLIIYRLEVRLFILHDNFQLCNYWKCFNLTVQCCRVGFIVNKINDENIRVAQLLIRKIFKLKYYKNINFQPKMQLINTKTHCTFSRVLVTRSVIDHT